MRTAIFGVALMAVMFSNTVCMRRKVRVTKKVLQKSYSVLKSLKNALNKPIYIPSFVPIGFELNSISYTQEKHRSVTHLHYTDGFLNFSLFQSIGKPPRWIQRMLKYSNDSSDKPNP